MLYLELEICFYQLLKDDDDGAAEKDGFILH